MSYAALWVKSNRSFLVGASEPEELVDRAHELGLAALALTDLHGVYGAVRAHTRAAACGLKLLLGAEVAILQPPLPGALLPPAERPGAGPEIAARAVLLATDRQGWAALCRLLTRAHRGVRSDTPPRGSPGLTLGELQDAVSAPLLTLSGSPWLLGHLAEAAGDRLYGLCCRHLHAEDRQREARLRAQASALGIPLVAATEVLYHDRQRRPLQDVVTCIGHRQRLSDAGTSTARNDEHDLKSITAFQRRFADAPELIARTLEITARCTFSLDQLSFREHRSADPGSLREQVSAGARRRYGGVVPEAAVQQLDRELALIEELDFAGYFLTMASIVRFCDERGILCQGRGSAANSLVCYCLGITAIDPLGFDLLFERFLSRERAEPPDIDLDIEHERREEVIQELYSRYGRRHAAMVASFASFRPRSAIREIGGVLGLPEAALARAAKLHDPWGDGIDPAVLATAGIDPEGAQGQLLRQLASDLLGSPRHLSLHPCGFLLGHDPIDTMVPIEEAATPGRTLIQWDKHDVAALRLFKIDLLGLGALTHLRRAFTLIAEHEGERLSLATIPAEDPATYAMLQAADSLGVFQLESRAQMAMLPRLRPAIFYDLVIELALVRPGPIQGEMVHPYLRRRCGDEPVDEGGVPMGSRESPGARDPELRAIFRRILGKTLGVPLFQEQVMRLAVELAGYSPGEADQLRKDMGASRSARTIDGHRERLLSRMAARGLAPEFATRLFEQIRGFGEYGFPESHAASFALIAYASAWLRRHHLPAFVCALLNAQPMGFYTPATIVGDARRHGVELRPVDLQRSQWEYTLEPRAPAAPTACGRWAIRCGLSAIRGLHLEDRLALAAAPPPYRDLRDLVERTGLRRDALHALAEAGALRAFGLDRRRALWADAGLAVTASDRLPLTAGAAGGAETKREDCSDLPLFAPLRRSEALSLDYQRCGLSALGHPLAPLRPLLRRCGLADAVSLRDLADRAPVSLVGLVISRQRPGTAKGVTFYTLEDERGLINVIVWPQIFERYAILGKTAALLGISGELQRSREGVIHVIARVLWDPQVQLRGLATFETPTPAQGIAAAARPRR